MPTVKGAVEWTTAKTSQFLDRLDRVLEDAVELLPGTVAAFSELIGASWSIIYVAVIGILLVLLRNWFFDNADSLAQNAGAVTGIINVAVGMLNATGIVVQLIIEAIGGLASLFGSKPGFPPFTPSTIPLLDPSAFEEACVVLPRQCAGVDTPGRLFQLALTPVASDSGICGFFRYIYPVEWAFQTLYPVAENLYLTYPPYPPGTGPPEYYGQNCTCPESYGCDYQWECIALASGIWILEFILPLIVLGCLWNGLIGKVFDMAIAVAEESVALASAVTILVMRGVDKIVTFIGGETIDVAEKLESEID